MVAQHKQLTGFGVASVLRFNNAKQRSALRALDLAALGRSWRRYVSADFGGNG